MKTKTTAAAAAKTTEAKVTDIRESLPMALKIRSAKPLWEVDGPDGAKIRAKFVQPLDKAGRLPKASGGGKPRLGKNRIVAKFVAGVTAAGAPLLFVGVFVPLKVQPAAA